MSSNAQNNHQSGSDEKPLPHLDTLLNRIKQQAEEEAKRRTTPEGQNTFSISFGPSKSINESIRQEKARKEKIANDIREKDQQLKENTLRKLFWFLGLETAVIFSLAFLQGFKWWRFELDQWSFRLVISATLGQITVMLIIAVKHLFPKK